MNKLTAHELALYLGCEGIYDCYYPGSGQKPVKCKFIGITSDKILLTCFDVNGKEWGNDITIKVELFKPLLRPLSDMMEEEANSLDLVFPLYNSELLLRNLTPDEFIFLLSKHFDLFSWIEKGLAFDASTLNQPK